MKTLSLLLLLAASCSAYGAGTPDFDYIDLSYAKVKLDGVPVRPAGWSMQGSFSLTPNVYLVGNYAMLNESYMGDLDIDTLSAGVGAKFTVMTSLALFAELTYENSALSWGNWGDEDIDGYGAAIGARGYLVDNLQATLRYKYIDSDEAGVDGSDSIRLALDYYIAREFALGVSYDAGDESDTAMVTGRYSF